MPIKATMTVGRTEQIILPTSSFEEARTLAREYDFGEGTEVTGCISLEQVDDAELPPVPPTHRIVTINGKDSLGSISVPLPVMASSDVEAACRAGAIYGRSQLPWHAIESVMVTKAE